MNINTGLRTLYKDKMYLCKHERDHVLGYLVVKERERGRESSIQVDSFNSILREITFFFIVTFFEQIFDLGDDLNLERPRTKKLCIPRILASKNQKGHQASLFLSFHTHK